MASPPRRQVTAYAVTLGVLLALVAGAWALDRFTSDFSAEVYRVVVAQDGEVLTAFSLDEIKAIGMRKVEVDGQLQEGPPLLDVLKAAGIDDFDSVNVTGQGIRDSGVIELDRDKIGRDIILDIAGRGTTKLVGPGIDYDTRVRDVIRIDVQ